MLKFRNFSLHTAPLSLLLVGAFGALLYIQTLHAPWYLDDFSVLVDYPGASQLSLNAKQFFGNRGPALFTFALNYRLGGLDPWGYHLVNLGFHLLTAGLVFLLLLRAVPTQRVLALLAALLFVAHPLQTQAVNYVVQRMTGLGSLLLLAALYLFVRFLECRQEERRHWSGRQLCFYLPALLAGALAVLTKENTAVLPFLLYLFERLVLRTGIPRRQLLLLVAPFALAPLWMGCTVLLIPLLEGTELRAITSLSANNQYGTITPLRYLFTEFSVLWVYLRLLFIPVGQALDYSYTVVKNLDNLRSLLALAGLLALGVFGWKMRRCRPLLSFAIAWFFLTLAVESSVIPLDPIFEHRLYLPMFGFCVALVDLSRHLPGRRSGIALLATLLLLYTSLTWQRNALWVDKVAFLEDNLRRVPHSERIMNNLAMHHINQGQLGLAVPLLRRALTLNPERRIEYGNLAQLYVDLGKFAEAAQVAQEGLRRFPGDERLWSILGQAFVRTGKIEAGLGYMRQAVAINPHYPFGLAELGRTLTRLDRFEEGAYWLRRALATFEVDASLHYDLALALRHLGQNDEARRELKRAAELDPRNSTYLLRFGLISLELGDRGSAAAMLTRLEALDSAAASTLRTELERWR